MFDPLGIQFKNKSHSYIRNGICFIFDSMLSRILYYFLLKPLSLFPLSVLYTLSNVVYYILFYVVGYRKKVVLKNLRNSFPEKNEGELQNISKKFYQHFCDLAIESIRLFSMPEEEAVKRCKCRNPELLERLFEEGKSLVLGCGHYNNWELTGVSFAAQVPHKILCIYSPLSNKFFDGKMRASREKYGANLIAKKEIRKRVEDNKNTPSIIVFGTDQNPSPRSNKLFWTTFLNQDTAVNFGMEKYAKDYDAPAVMMKIHKIKRGYYEFEFEMITEKSPSTKYGEITIQHTKILEQQIIDKPEFWLWTHKRWKRKKNDDLSYVYHFTSRNYFSKFKDKEEYFPPTFKEEKFIHMCFPRQFDHVYLNYCQNVEDLIVLKIETQKLKQEIIIEKASNGDSFPHLYAGIHKEAIVEIKDYPS